MKLNPAQEEALSLNQSLLVEANAGSGKTTVMAERFIKLLQHNPKLEPQQILTITFTNLAAFELKERILSLLNKRYYGTDLHKRTLSQYNQLAITTIHGFCSMVLRRFPFEANLDPDFTIIEPQEANLLFNDTCVETIDDLIQSSPQLIRPLLTRLSKKRLLEQLNSLYQRSDLSLKWVETLTGTYDSETYYTHLLGNCFKHTVQRFQKNKLNRAYLDYHDLLHTTQKLLDEPFIQKQLQTYYAYIMVDEFQDTDPIQWDIIQKCADTFHPLQSQKLFLVGDSKQSIYSFRGADSELFHQVSEQFLKINNKETKIVHLADNYRTQSGLINNLNPIFEKLFNKTAYTPLKANRTSLQNKSISLYLNEEKTPTKKQAEQTVLAIQSFLANHSNYTVNDIAVLSRKKAPLNAIKTCLETENIPCFLHAESGFFTKNIVLDCIALVKGLINPADQLAWTRVLLSPIFKKQPATLYQWLNHHPWPGTIDGFSNEILTQFGLAHLPAYIKKSTLHSPVEVAQDVLTKEKAWSSYQAIPSDSTDELERCLQFLSKLWLKSKGNRYLFLELLESYIEHQQSPDSGQSTAEKGIQLLSIHASKGLEFPVIFFVDIHSNFNTGSSDSLLISKHGIHLNMNPSQSLSETRSALLNKISADVLEEEKRLFYVACTRARDYLLFLGNQKSENKQAKSYLDFIKNNSQIQAEPIPDRSVQTSLFTHNHCIAEPSKELGSPIYPHQAKSFKLRTLSVSQIEQILRCSKQFFLSPLLKHLTNNNNDHSQYGQALHQAFSKQLSANLKPNQTEEKQFKTEFIHLKNSVIFAEQQTANNCFVEHPFSVRFQNLIMTGRIDLCYETETHWTVVDFKSSFNHNPEQYQLQLELYALALIRTYNIQKPIHLLLYEAKTGATKTYSFQKEKALQLSNQLNLIPEIIIKQYFKAPARKTCEHCPVFQTNPNCPNLPIKTS